MHLAFGFRGHLFGRGAACSGRPSFRGVQAEPPAWSPTPAARRSSYLRVASVVAAAAQTAMIRLTVTLAASFTSGVVSARFKVSNAAATHSPALSAANA